MRNFLNSTPTSTSFAPETVQTSSGSRILEVITGGTDRKFSGHHSIAGGGFSPSVILNRHIAIPVLGLVAALAVVVLFLLPGGPLHAQDADGPITYAEDRKGPVATFTAVDPEGRPTYWSLATSEDVSALDEIADSDNADVAQFSINASGVLSFNFQPNYEEPPSSNSTANTYKVVVIAADEPLGAASRALGSKKVTINVTDVDEDGVVTLDAQQPQANKVLTATLIDDDASDDQQNAAKWKWEYAESKDGPWTPILTAISATYSPLGVVDKYLRATATYTDEHGSDRNAQAVSPHPVRAVPAANNANPVFSDEDTGTTGTQVGRKVDENSPPGTRVGSAVTANDASGDVLTYTLGDGGDNVSYGIDPATGQITVGPRTALDFDVNPSDTVSVTATDPAGGATTQPVTITINDVNEVPVITAGDTKASVDETTPITTQVGATYIAYPEVSGNPCTTETCTWSLKGRDAGDFNIGNQTNGTPGELTFKEVSNYEAPADADRDNVYMVTVVVTDTGKSKLSAERDMVVTVDNMDEDGTVTLSSLAPKVGVVLTAMLSDPDGGETDVKWQWYDDAINPSDPDDNAIDGATMATYTPKDGDVDSTLSVRAAYADAGGPGQSAIATAANDVLPDLAAKAPVFKPKPTSRSVPENYASGDSYGDPPVEYPAVGAVVTATDANDDTLTYTLVGADAGSFNIDQVTGQISVKTGTELDFEPKATYMVTVTATDPDGLSDSVDVTIKLTNVDEGPVIAGDDVSRDYRENGTGSVATLRATDPEGRPVYWSLATSEDVSALDEIADSDNADVAQFSINASGVLSFNFPPNYEEPPSSNSTANTYKVVVVAADEPLGAASRALGSKKVTVNVTNLDETETVTLSLRAAQVGTEVTATYNDLDNERPAGTELTWKWYLGGSEIPEAATAIYSPTASGTHRVEASYTKTDGNKKSVSATISVRPTPSAANVSPAFPSGSDKRSVDENSPPRTRVGSAVTATDPGDVLTYTLGDGGDNVSYGIDPATGQITVGPRTALDFDVNPSDTVSVTATDPAGGATTQPVTITINDVNEVPVITAGDTKASVDETTPITTQVGATYIAYPEVSGNPCTTETCTWSLKGRDAGDFNIGNQTNGTPGELTFKEVSNYEAPADADRDNVYMVTVVVTDTGKSKLSAERDMVVTVDNMDEDGTVTLSSLAPKVGVVLTAMLSDPDGGETDVKWQWYDDAINPNDPDDNAIDGATMATYTPKDGDVDSTLSVRAAYADAGGPGQSAIATAANEVVPDLAAKAPVFKPKPTSRSVPENYASGDSYGDPPVEYPAVGAVVTATDANDHTLTYTLVGADAGSFNIDQVTGQISVKTGTELDFEPKATYMVTVTATDPDGLSDSVDVTIKLTNVDEGPVIMVGGLTISVGLNSVDYQEGGTGAVETYSASGPDADMATWSLEGIDAGDFSISSSGELTFVGTPDHENPTDMDMDNVYMVTVMANDGTLDATQMVTVTVTNVDELGMLMGDASPVYLEKGANPVETYTADGSSTASWSLDGDDMVAFTLGGASGELMFASSPDFEAPTDMDTDNVYNVTVKAEAGGEMGMMEVMVTVTDKNEDGVVTLIPATPVVGTAVMATLEDPDAGLNAESVTWKWDTVRVSEGTEEIMGVTDGTYTPAESDLGAHLQATATYTDVHGMQTATKTTEGAVVSRNTVPEFPDTETGDRSVAENTAPGENVGDPVTATDADRDDTLTYALSGTDAASFAIDEMSGQLMTNDALDFEATTSYMVVVTATDGSDASATITVTITVTNVDEQPVVAGDATADYPENEEAAVANYTGTDPDGVTVIWSLSGDDAEDFEISEDGMLTFKESPNFEAPADMNTDNVYMVTVEASDGTLDAMQMVTVTVTDVDEDGMVALSPSHPVVDGEVMATLTDPDGSVTGMTWQWSRSMDMATWMDIADTNSATYTVVEADNGHYLKATVDYTDGEGSDKNAAGTTANAVTAGDPLVNRYDADNSGTIDKSEVITAINDYLFEETLSKAEVIELINLYLFDS